MRVLLTVMVPLFTALSSAAMAIDCPAPSQNVAKEVVTDTEGNVSGLRSLVGGSLKNRTEVTAKNLFEKYPNADRVAIGTTMLSMYCRQVDASRELTDADKLDRFQTVFQTVTTLMVAK